MVENLNFSSVCKAFKKEKYTIKFNIKIRMGYAFTLNCNILTVYRFDASFLFMKIEKLVVDKQNHLRFFFFLGLVCLFIHCFSCTLDYGSAR